MRTHAHKLPRMSRNTPSTKHQTSLANVLAVAVRLFAFGVTLMFFRNPAHLPSCLTLPIATTSVGKRKGSLRFSTFANAS